MMGSYCPLDHMSARRYSVETYSDGPTGAALTTEP